jgi:hypothetical protein
LLTLLAGLFRLPSIGLISESGRMGGVVGRSGSESEQSPSLRIMGGGVVGNFGLLLAVPKNDGTKKRSCHRGGVLGACEWIGWCGRVQLTSTRSAATAVAAEVSASATATIAEADGIVPVSGLVGLLESATATVDTNHCDFFVSLR